MSYTTIYLISIAPAFLIILGIDPRGSFWDNLGISLVGALVWPLIILPRIGHKLS